MRLVPVFILVPALRRVAVEVGPKRIVVLMVALTLVLALVQEEAVV